MSMRRTILTLAMVLVMSACGTSDPITQANEPQSGDATGAAGDGEAETAKVGDTITLTDMEGNNVEVTLLRVVDPATPPRFLEPKKSDRLVGIEIRIVPLDSTYDDSPEFNSTLVDADGREYDWDGTEAKEGAGFGGSATISAADKRVGLITFAVPKRVKLATFQFTMALGIASGPAQWEL